MLPIRDPKEITVSDGNGKERKFTISKMTAWDGMEIMARLPSGILTGSLPKIGDWEAVRDLQLKIMKYVSVNINGQQMPLSTQALIDNHAGDWECFARLMVAEVEYNNSFFRNGTISDFFGGIARQYLASILETLTRSSEPSSLPEKPPSSN